MIDQRDPKDSIANTLGRVLRGVSPWLAAAAIGLGRVLKRGQVVGLFVASLLLFAAGVAIERRRRTRG